MGIFDKNGRESRITAGITTIANGTRIEGKIDIECNLQIDGIFKGELFSKGSIIIGEHGVIEGRIFANHLTCSGVVKGTILVNALDILQNGQIYGEINYATLRIDQGGILEGTTHKIESVQKLEEEEKKKFLSYDKKSEVKVETESESKDEIKDEVEEVSTEKKGKNKK